MYEKNNNSDVAVEHELEARMRDYTIAFKALKTEVEEKYSQGISHWSDGMKSDVFVLAMTHGRFGEESNKEKVFSCYYDTLCLMNDVISVTKRDCKKQ